MKKLRFSLLILMIFIITQTIANTPAKNPLVKDSYKIRLFNNFQSHSFNFEKKGYYEKIFTKDEQKQLSKADKHLISAKKYMAQYNSYQSEIEKQYTIAEATSSGKSMSKALKKAKKIETKALKKGNKALSYYNKAFSIRSKIYATAINRTRLSDDSKNAKIGHKIELKAKTLFDEALNKVSTAPVHDEQMKFDALKVANDLRLQAFELQEAAFGFYANDTNLNHDDYLKTNKIIVNKKVISADTNFFPKNVEQYKPLKDANLYKSKANLILPRLKLSSQELNQIVDANKKNTYANNLMRKVDKAYYIVDSLNMQAELQTDLLLKDKMKQQAIEKEQNAFYKLLNATNIYLNANEIRYNIYKNHFTEVRQKNKVLKSERAAVMEREAIDYFTKANSQKRSARNMMYKSDQYIKLMGANDLQLYALQLQESAYGIYLNIPTAISSKIDTAFITENVYNDTKNSTKKENTSSKLSWKVLSTYKYSSVKPKPVKYKTKNEILFHVQLGIFKGLLPPKKFAKVNPVIFDKFVKNPYRRYLVGEYRSYEAADLALKHVKKMGYNDAYIISKIDGQRESYAFGKAKLVFNKKYNSNKIHELSAFSGVSYSDVSNSDVSNSDVSNSANQNKDDGNNRNVKNVKGLAYYIQLGMFLKPVSSSDFQNIEPIFTEKIPSKGTRYMTGPYNSLVDARSAENKIKSSGIADAYIIAYNNGLNISLTKAKQIEKPGSRVNSDNNNYSSGIITFCVQVGAYKNKLNNADFLKLSNTFTPRKVEIKYSEGMNLYIIGNYKSYNEAKYLKNKLHSEGQSDCFVVAFKGETKISIGEAIKLSDK
ncbi:MAG: SPOR domain-containing protein [Bacteroidota bacterium]